MGSRMVMEAKKSCMLDGCSKEAFTTLAYQSCFEVQNNDNSETAALHPASDSPGCSRTETTHSFTKKLMKDIVC